MAPTSRLTAGGMAAPLNTELRAQGYEGKLRLLYEANPFALIVEQAGGLASTGDGRILDVTPREIHQRSPVILGSRGEVNHMLSGYLGQPEMG